MAVSGRDRDYMRRIGEAKAASHAETAAAHERAPSSQALLERQRAQPSPH